MDLFRGDLNFLKEVVFHYILVFFRCCDVPRV